MIRLPNNITFLTIATIIIHLLSIPFVRANSDTPSFSTETGTLSLPYVEVDGVILYKNVELALNFDTLQFSTKNLESIETKTVTEIKKVINHSQPDLKSDLNAFLESSGCETNQDGEIEGCEALLSETGCDEFRKVNDLWGGLAPVYPMVVCRVKPYLHSDPLTVANQVTTEGYITAGGGYYYYYERYVLLVDGQFQVIKNTEALKDIFAPIESRDEALSYALMVTGLSAYYSQTIDTSYRYFSNYIEDTHVVENLEGYEVLLYYFQFFGCGSHTTSTSTVQVNHDGSFVSGPLIAAYENPELDNLCID